MRKIASSVAVSLVAVFCLNYYFLPLFNSPGTKNPLAIVATATFLITAWVITAMVTRVRKLTEAQLTLRFEERLAERTRIARVDYARSSNFEPHAADPADPGRTRLISPRFAAR